MPFDNYYANRKDWRRPYRKSKAFDRSCRNHGSCAWCEGNRLYSYWKRSWLAEQQVIEWWKGEFDEFETV